jgi:predicted nucleotide-binding protein
MAQLPTQPQEIQNSKLSAEQMELGITRLKKRVTTLENFDPSALTTQNEAWAAITPLKADIEDALSRTFNINSVEYRRYRAAAYLNPPIGGLRETPIGIIVERITQNKKNAISLLNTAIHSLEEQIQEASISTAAITAPNRLAHDGNRKIFIVHGHDIGARETVARFLENCNFEPIILHEQANKGRTIIEKFEAHANVGFAIVLLTPDDKLVLPNGEYLHRARQNVILELGYFIGQLGRKRVCALKSGDVEIPSDVLGVVWTDFDSGGAWKQALARELKAADYDIDWNDVMGS